MKLAEDLRRSVLHAAIEGKLTGGGRDGWRFVRLDEIGEIIGGGTPSTLKSEYWVHGQIAWITPADMGTLKSKYISHGVRNITEKGLASSSARMMPKGSIIFSSRAPIGYIAIAENDLCTNQGCKSVRLYDGILSEYVYFALLAMRDDIKKMGSGTTFKEISGRIFSSVIIPLPPINEQRRIVSRLDAIMPLIAGLESAENELEALERRFPGDMRDSLLQAAIEGRLTASNTDNWRYVRLGDVVANADDFFDGDWILKDNMDANGQIRLLQLQDIGKGIFLDKSSKYINEQTFTKLKCRELREGDLMISRMAEPIARSCIVPKFDYRVITVVDVAVVRCDESIISNRYLNFVCNSKYFMNAAVSKARGSTRLRITRSHLAQIPILLPPIDEQKRIVTRLNELIPLCDAIENLS